MLLLANNWPTWENQLKQTYFMYQLLCGTVCIVDIPHNFIGAVVLDDGGPTTKLPSEHPSGKIVVHYLYKLLDVKIKLR